MDNFKPFIQNLTITHEIDEFPLNSETELFDIGWVCLGADDELTLTDVDQNINFSSYPNSFDFIKFTAKSSEPLDTLTLTLITDSPPLTEELELELVSVSADRTEWQFKIGAIDLLASDYTLSFIGKDMAGNELLNLHDFVETGFKVPTRNSASGTNQWSTPNLNVIPQGADVTFSIISNCDQHRPVITGEEKILGGVSINFLVPSPDSSCFYVTSEVVGSNSDEIPTGSIDLTVEGGVGTLSYYWSTGEITEDISGLRPGIYNVKISDQLCCISEYSFEVENLCPTPMTIEFQTVQQPCPGDHFGIFSVDSLMLGGMPPYSYLWSYNGVVLNNTTSGNEITDGTEGAYCVTVTDTNGCNNNACYELKNEPECSNTNCPKLLSGIKILKNPCFGLNNGFLTVDLFPNIDVHSILWSNGESGSSILNVPAGEYCVSVTDINACVKVACILLNEKTFPLSVSFDKTLPSGPYAMDGAINTNVTGGNPPYDFRWLSWPQGYIYTTPNINNLEGGWYDLRVRSSGCFEAIEHVYLNYECPPYLIEGIQPHGFIECEGETGRLTVTLSGMGAPPYSILWSTGDTTETIENLNEGYYSVTVTDAVGCSTKLGLKMYVINPIEINAEVIGVCEPEKGEISLDVSGSEGDYNFQWSNGATSQSIYNLEAGEYCVTVTNSTECSKDTCFSIPITKMEIADVKIRDNSCGTSCDGSIEPIVISSSPVSYQWSNGATTSRIEGLCGGNYTVTITSGSCVKEYSYTLNGAEEGFEYEVQIVSYFGHDEHPSLSAGIKIISSVFDFGGSLYIVETEETINILPFGGGVFNVSILPEFSDVELFHFIYTDENGCVYEGTFDMIPTCKFPDHFAFTASHIGAIDEACNMDILHSYEINVAGVGDNHPYFIEVTMDDAFDESNSGFKKVVEYVPGENSFIIDSIPAGTVRFEAKNYCDSSPFFANVQTNCCYGLPCGHLVLREGSSDAYSGSHFYDFPYFRLWVEEECFDRSTIPIIDPHSSKIVARLFTSASINNCWTGTVTIKVTSGFNSDDETLVGLPSVFTVSENTPFDEIEWTSEEGIWDPPAPGTYFVKVSYVGDEHNYGINCDTTILVNFFGEGNYNDIVGIVRYREITQSLRNAPSNFKESYFGAWRCGNCEETATDYVYSEMQGASEQCDFFENYRFTFFNYEPNLEPNGEFPSDPCNAGGTLVIIDFDVNGSAVIKTIIIPPNVSLDELNNKQPISGAPNGTYCYNSGWCLFDAMDVYGFEMDRPLLASWWEESSCIDLVWPGSPETNPNPCNDETNPCPPGFECVGGNCLQPCMDDNACLPGVCGANGYCEGSNVCNPPCPPGYHCEDNSCFSNDNICDVDEEVAGGSGNRFYEYYTDPGTVVEFSYNTLHLPDQIFITCAGVTVDLDGCVGTNGWETYPTHFTIGSDHVFAVEIDPCQAGSHYNFTISCVSPVPNLQKKEEVSLHKLLASNNNSKEIGSIHPNPFLSNIDIEISNIEVPFLTNIVILDVLGREVNRSEFNLKKGYNLLNITGLENLRKGVYVLLVKRKKEIYASKKIIKIE